MAAQAIPKKHILPGEHVYDGITFCDIFPAEVLQRAKDFPFHDKDILIATYPKSYMSTFEMIRVNEL